MKSTLTTLLLILVISLAAQDKSVQTVDAIVLEVLDVISVEKGENIDTDRFRSLFLPDARFTVLYHPVDSMPVSYESVSLDEFSEILKDEYYSEGFSEIELGKTINEYNGIANVFQSFYIKDSEGHEIEGITSYQLLWQSNRWWIADVLWTTDTNGVPVPEKYLDKTQNN